MLTRHDSHLSRLGERGDRNLWRLWTEETRYDRLRRNNFNPGTAFEVKRRPGLGVTIERVPFSRTHVSSRRGNAVLSYEAPDLRDIFPQPEVRFRIHVNHITVVPSLRLPSVARPASEAWMVKGTTLWLPRDRAVELRTASPLHLPGTADSIHIVLDELNLVFVTELIGNVRPRMVHISGSGLLMTVASQFLHATGYGDGALPGNFIR